MFVFFLVRIVSKDRTQNFSLIVASTRKAAIREQISFNIFTKVVILVFFFYSSEIVVVNGDVSWKYSFIDESFFCFENFFSRFFVRLSLAKHPGSVDRRTSVNYTKSKCWCIELLLSFREWRVRARERGIISFNWNEIVCVWLWVIFFWGEKNTFF